MELPLDSIMKAIAIGNVKQIYNIAFIKFNNNPTPQLGDKEYIEQCIELKLPKPFPLSDDENKHFQCSVACNSPISSITFDLCQSFYSVLWLILRKRLGGCTCQYKYLETEKINWVDIDEYIHNLKYSNTYFSKKFLQKLSAHCEMVLKKDNGCVHYTFWRRVAQFVIRMRHHRSFIMTIEI